MDSSKMHKNCLCERNRYKSTIRNDKNQGYLESRRKSEMDFRDDRYRWRKDEFCNICTRPKVRNCSRRVTFEGIENKSWADNRKENNRWINRNSNLYFRTYLLVSTRKIFLTWNLFHSSSQYSPRHSTSRWPRKDSWTRGSRTSSPLRSRRTTSDTTKIHHWTQGKEFIAIYIIWNSRYFLNYRNLYFLNILYSKLQILLFVIKNRKCNIIICIRNIKFSMFFSN